MKNQSDARQASRRTGAVSCVRKGPIRTRFHRPKPCSSHARAISPCRANAIGQNSPLMIRFGARISQRRRMTTGIPWGRGVSIPQPLTRISSVLHKEFGISRAQKGGNKRNEAQGCTKGLAACKPPGHQTSAHAVSGNEQAQRSFRQFWPNQLPNGTATRRILQKVRNPLPHVKSDPRGEDFPKESPRFSLALQSAPGINVSPPGHPHASVVWQQPPRTKKKKKKKKKTKKSSFVVV